MKDIFLLKILFLAFYIYTCIIFDKSDIILMEEY
jgi:hypothetical protein